MLPELPQPELLRTVAFAVWRFRRLVAAVVLILLFATLAALLFKSTTYQSTARILVGEGRERPFMGDEQKRDAIFRTKEESINSEVAILSSAYLRKQVIERLGPEVMMKPRVPPKSVLGKIRAGVSDLFAALGELVRGLFVRMGVLDPVDRVAEGIAAVERGLVVSSMRKADVIELSMRSPNPEGSVRTLQTLIDLYLERHNEVHRTPGLYEFFGTQAERARERLAEAEERLQEFRSKEGLAAIDEQKRLLLSQINDATTAIERTGREIMELEARLKRLRGDLRRTSKTVTVSEVRQRNPVLDTIENRLVELRLHREKLSARYQADSRVITDMDREIERLRDLAAKSKSENVSSVTAGENTLYKELEQQLYADEAKLASLRASHDAHGETLDAARERLDTLLSKETTLNELAREVEMNQSDFATYRKGLESRRIDNQMDLDRIAKVAVIEPPTSPARPVGPSKILILAIVPVIGLILGMALAVAAHSHDRTVWREQDLARLTGLPVLASFPEGNVGRGKAKRAKPAQRDAQLSWRSPPYRRLATRLINGAQETRAFALLGIERDENITSTLVNLAAALAKHTGRDIVLVDADFDTPALGSLGAVVGAGLADVVEGRVTLDDAIVPANADRVAILPAGRAQTNALEVLENARFALCLNELKSRYRAVLVRGAPLSDGQCANQLALLMDGNIVVVKAGHTQRESIGESTEHLHPLGERFFGLVLIDAPRLPRWIAGA